MCFSLDSGRPYSKPTTTGRPTVTRLCCPDALSGNGTNTVATGPDPRFTPSWDTPIAQRRPTAPHHTQPTQQNTRSRPPQLATGTKQRDERNDNPPWSNPIPVPSLETSPRSRPFNDAVIHQREPVVCQPSTCDERQATSTQRPVIAPPQRQPLPPPPPPPPPP